MLQWFSNLAQAVFTLGYPGVVLALIIEGLGLPFPGDAVMAFYGFAAAEGKFHLGFVILCSTIGYLIGTQVSYWVSRIYGVHLLNRLSRIALLNQRSMWRTTQLMDRYGALLLIPGRFLPGVRSVSSYVAGLSQMDFRTFLLYTSVSAVLWCATWAGLGYWLGDHVQIVIDTLQSSFAYATLGGILLVALIYLIRRKLAR